MPRVRLDTSRSHQRRPCFAALCGRRPHPLQGGRVANHRFQHKARPGGDRRALPPYGCTARGDGCATLDHPLSASRVPVRPTIGRLPNPPPARWTSSAIQVMDRRRPGPGGRMFGLSAAGCAIARTNASNTPVQPWPAHSPVTHGNQRSKSVFLLLRRVAHPGDPRAHRRDVNFPITMSRPPGRRRPRRTTERIDRRSPPPQSRRPRPLPHSPRSRHRHPDRGDSHSVAQRLTRQKRAEVVTQTHASGGDPQCAASEAGFMRLSGLMMSSPRCDPGMRCGDELVARQHSPRSAAVGGGFRDVGVGPRRL